MTLPKENKKLTRFIHECFHEIARDEEMKDVWRDMVSIIITKWEEFKDKTLTSPEHQSQEYMKSCIPPEKEYYGDRVCKKCDEEIPYGVKECPCEKKPQEIELLREISSDMADFDDVYDNRVAINEIIRFIQDENR